MEWLFYSDQLTKTAGRSPKTCAKACTNDILYFEDCVAEFEARGFNPTVYKPDASRPVSFSVSWQKRPSILIPLGEGTEFLGEEGEELPELYFNLGSTLLKIDYWRNGPLFGKERVAGGKIFRSKLVWIISTLMREGIWSREEEILSENAYFLINSWKRQIENLDLGHRISLNDIAVETSRRMDLPRKAGRPKRDTPSEYTFGRVEIPQPEPTPQVEEAVISEPKDPLAWIPADLRSNSRIMEFLSLTTVEERERFLRRDTFTGSLLRSRGFTIRSGLAE
jgi:hypothetical protein